MSSVRVTSLRFPLLCKQGKTPLQKKGILQVSFYQGFSFTGNGVNKVKGGPEEHRSGR